MADPHEPTARAVSAFRRDFGRDPSAVVQAPGRVNLIGEHTDYNDGFVLPCAIDRATVVAIGPAASATIRVTATDFGGARDDFALGSPIVRRDELGWGNYVRGIVSSMLASGHTVPGADLAIAGDIPQGAGLASSASLGVALTHAFAAMGAMPGVDATGFALIAQRSENDFVGCACGIMDQLAVAKARAGHALLIDCRSLETKPIPMAEDIALLVIHSGITRGLVDSAYNERRTQCAAAARHYGVAALRDLDEAMLEAGRRGLDQTSYRRARHVVTENRRTLSAADALAVSDLAALGELMAESHASMRDDFEITLPPIDRLVEIAADAIAGAGGARMTGGGFGGCVVALARTDRLAHIAERVTRSYRARDGAPSKVLQCRPSRGAGRIDL